MPDYECCLEPHYHSIIGQKLLLVDWIRVYGADIPCPDRQCNGRLHNTRTNFSKSQTLFPIFNIEGGPTWCMVQVMECACCHRTFDANEGTVMARIPQYMACSYPVEMNFALAGKQSHLSRGATEVFRHMMLTYGNGEMCSRILYDVLNRDYIKRIKCYYSMARQQQKKPEPYLVKDGTFIKAYPPLGDTVRAMWGAAAATNCNPWGISDDDRHTREIQSVQCSHNGIIAQDHTFEIVKNYPKSLGAKACWDVATSTGEIATAVLVPSTRTQHFSHAAIQLSKRRSFAPKAMYSDTWPHKKDYWEAVFPGIEGRLGLFHFEKRILSTLRKGHIDHMDAVTDLLAALYSYNNDDYEKLLAALQNGTLSQTGKKYSLQEITELKQTKLFRDRYAKYLRKRLNGHLTMIERLDDWFCKYKVTSSDGTRPARGRLDPIKGVSLFTSDTKRAVENCKEKAQFLSDPYPFCDMYDAITPNPKCPHQLVEYLSKQGESKLES